MHPKKLIIVAAVGLLVLNITACGMLDEYDRRAEYQKSTTLPALELPPELDASIEEQMLIPGGAPATYSEYSRSQAEGRPGSKTDLAVMPQTAGISVQREGKSRWLKIDQPADRLWEKTRDFWLESGFLLKRDEQKLGILETEWTENRGDIPQDIIRRTLGKVADFLWSASTRDKFRTRLERGADGGTEIFISHRGAEEVAQGDNFVWQFRPNDPELEAEMLTRLMLYLGVDEQQAEQQVAAAQEKTQVAVVQQDDALLVSEDFPRTWRRVGLLLDRSGFTVEDRNRSEGIYFVQYVPADAHEDEKSLLESLAFWRSSKPESREFQIKLSELGEQTRINILNKEGQAAEAATTEQLLQVLMEKLK